MSERAAAAISRLFNEFGNVLLDQPGKLKSLLMDEVPEAKSEISILLRALEENVPQDLMRVDAREPAQAHVSRLSIKLQQRGFAADASKSAVETWAQALGMDGSTAPANGHAAGAYMGNGASNGAANGATNGATGSAMNGAMHMNGQSDPVSLNSMNGAAAMSFAGAAIDGAGAGGIGGMGGIGGPGAPAGGAGGSRPVSGGDAQRNKFGWLGIIVLLAAVAGGGLYYKSTLPEVKISSVDVPGGFIGDGKPHRVSMDFQARNATPTSVIVRYVGGDLTGFPSETTVPISPSAAQSGHLELGAYSYRATAPAQGKFQYIVQTSDGKRSEPFEQTVNVTPVPAQLPKIVNVTMPNKLVTGQPITISIAYADAEFGVTKLERKVVQSTTNWDPVRTLDFNMADKSSGALTYEISKDIAPNTSTFEFTLIDARGNRSAPQRVTFTVDPAPKQIAVVPHVPVATDPYARRGNAGAPCFCGTVIAIQEVRQPGQGSGVGAVAGAGTGALLGNQFGHGTGRTLATLGGALFGALGGNQVEKQVRAQTVYEITLQMDNGGRQVIRQSSPPSVARGMRAKIVGGTVQPV